MVIVPHRSSLCTRVGKWGGFSLAVFTSLSPFVLKTLCLILKIPTVQHLSEGPPNPTHSDLSPDPSCHSTLLAQLFFESGSQWIFSLSGLEFHLVKFSKRPSNALLCEACPDQHPCSSTFPLSSTPDIWVFNHLFPQCILNAGCLPSALLGARVRTAKPHPAPPPQRLRAWWALLTHPFLHAPFPVPTLSEISSQGQHLCLTHISLSTHSNCLSSSSLQYITDYVYVWVARKENWFIPEAGPNSVIGTTEDGESN